jgi:hypothetical protein
MTTAQTGFLHQVYFWLREGGTAEDAARLVQGCHAHLGNIPGVLRLVVGVPAGTPRAVVDNSYAVALLVEFADGAAHDAYQVHPDHLRFVEECGPLWSRVQIYDALVS